MILANDSHVELQLSRRLFAALKRLAHESGLTMEAVIIDAIWFSLAVAAEEEDREGEGER